MGESDESLDPPLSEPDPTLAGADEPEQTIEDLLRLSETAVAGAYDPEETVEDLLRRHAQQREQLQQQNLLQRQQTQRAAEERREEGEQRTAEYVEQHKQALGGSREKRSIDLEELAVGGYDEYPEPAPSEPGTPEFSKWLVEKQMWDRHQRQKGKTIVQREKNYAKWYQEAIERSEKGDFDIKTPEYVIKKTPFIGTVAEGVEVYEFVESVEKIKNKTAEARDFNVVVSMLRRQENEADSSWGDAVLDTIASLPGFAVEFGLTGGAGTAGRALAARYLRKVLGKYAKKKAAQVAIKGGAIATGIGLRTAAMPQQVFAATTQKMTPEVDRGAILSGDAEHALSAIDNTTSKDFGTALLKGLGSTYTEVLTESVGPVLNKVFAKIGAGTGASRIKKAVTDHLLGERKLTPDRLKGIYAKGGWDGLFAEFGEERLGELIRGLTGIEDDYGATGDVLSGDPERIKQGLYDMSVEGGAFFAPTAIRSTRHLFRPMAGERAFNTESEEAQEFIANPSRNNAKKLGVHGLAPSAKERKKLAEEMEAWEGFKKGMWDVATSPREADSAIRITEARARALGESPGSFVKRRIRGVEKHDSYEGYMKSVRQDQTGLEPGVDPKEYKQQGGSDAQEADFRSGVGPRLPSGPRRVRGHIQMHEDGTNTIRVFADAQDASTLIHELGHLFIQDLGPKDIGTVGRWAGAKKNEDDQWVFSREAHEKWARGFERYLRDGKAPSNKLKRAFKKFKKWLTEIYGVIKGSPIDVEISPQIRDVFDRMLTETVEGDLQRDLTSAGADGPEEQTPSSGAGGLGVITPATEGVGENITKAGRKTMVALRRAFASKGLKTEHMDDTITGRDGFILKHTTAIQQNTAELKKAYRRINGRRAEITPKEAERFNRALQDPEVMKEMPLELAVPLTEMRDHVDTLSRRLYELVGEDSDLGSAIEERFGKYLTRTYKKFTDPGWVDKALADTQIMADFAAEVRGHAPKATKAEIRTLAEQMLRRDTRSLKSVSSGVQGYVNVMKKRKVDSPAIRALYGEHKDVFINYRQTVSNIAKLVANKEAMADILEVGLKTGIMSTDQSHGHTHEVNHKKLPQLEIFEGVFMDETTAQALEDVYDEFTRVGGILGDLQRSYLGLSLAGKAALTVGSWTATVRNLFSGVGQSLSNGMVSKKNMKKAAEIVWWDGVKGALSTEATSKKDRETKQRLVELRVIEDVAYDELKGIGKEIVRGESYPGVQITDNMEVGEWGRAKLAISAGRAVAKGAGKVYQSMDAVRRVATFLEFMKDYKEAFPEMSKKELEEFCAKRLRDLDPTYSRASKAAKLWSRYFPWGPFSMFHAEQIRTNANRVKIIREEMSSDNAVLRRLGRRKFIGTAAWLALPNLAAKSWHAFIGLSPEEEEELRERTAFSANSDVVFLSWNREAGKYKYLDLSYSDPFGVLKRTIRGGLRKGGAEAAGEFLSPFTGEDVAAKALKELYDGDVADEGVDEYTQIKQIAEHLRDLVTPQTIKAWKKIQGISPGKRAPEITATITGFRVSEGDIDRTDGFATRKFVRTMRASEDDVRKKLKYGDIEDLVQYYESAERKRKKTFNEWADYIDGSSVLGVPKSATTLDNHLNNRHKKLVRQVIADSYVPFRPSPTTINWLEKGKEEADKYDKHKWEARITAGKLIIQMAKEADSDSTTKP